MIKACNHAILDDFNRVKLKDSTSDYINASFIHVCLLNTGRENVRVERLFQVGNDLAPYIAAQGPIGDDETLCGRRISTVTDFWRMVWNESVECIVMLTKCVEGIKV